jgi:hypothetical protein
VAATIPSHPGPFPEDTGALILIDRPSAQTSTASRPRRTTAAWPLLTLRIVALAAIVLVIFVRIRLRNVPLERDEGEYAYTGQLMLEGIQPFRLASNMKLPGTDAAYALSLAVFGENPAGVHLGLLVVNLGAVTLLFFLGRRLFGEVAGWVAAAAYALLSAGIRVLGTSSHATHFVVLPALAASLLLLRWKDSRWLGVLFWSGLLYGLAFLMKQPGVVFGLFGAVYLLWSTWRESRARGIGALREFGVFAAAGTLPYAVTCLLLWRAGVFLRFWFWTVTYARAYGSIRHEYGQVVRTLFFLLRSIIWSNWPLWFLAVIGGVLLWCNKRYRGLAVWTTAFLVFSFLAVCPGLYFRPHYFLLLLPAVALLAGAGVELAGEYVPKRLLIGIVAVAFVISVILPRQLFFRADDTQASRLMYGLFPFPESRLVGDYIRLHSGQDARMAVLGSEPEIYFYARRHSASDYIYTYALVEPQPFALQMQNAMIHDIETVDPEYIVEVHVYNSWLFTPDSPHRILDWFANYSQKHYQLVGVADMVSKTTTIYKWDQAAARYQLRSGSFLRVFKRR